MKEILETQMEDEEWIFVLEQVEKAKIVVEKEVVEDLGNVECKEESRVVGSSSVEFESDAEEGAQPLKHIMNEELEEMEQATSSLSDDDFASAYDFLELKESSPIEFEADVEIDFTQPPTYDLSNGKELEEIGEENIQIEESCQVVEVSQKGRMGVEITLSRPLETSLPEQPPSILSFKITDRKGKSKAKASSSKRKRTQPAAEIVDELLYERQLSEKEKADQNTPSSDGIKSANLYCELRFLHFLEKRSLHVERKL
ncbi:hypothetical protein AHAS_Ahas19G0296500 [Arachis hypogaea]